jgi:ABC-2 type transport system ATP-binding protein
MEPNDIISRKNEIENYIGTAGLRSAVGRFIDLSRELGSASNLPYLLSSRFHTIESNEGNNRRTKEEISIEKGAIENTLLSALSILVDETLQESLKKKIEQSKKIINSSLEEGYKSVLEVANVFGSVYFEHELTVLKEESENAPLSKEQLVAYADLILKNYKPQDAESKFYRNLSQSKAELTPIPNELIVLAENIQKTYFSTQFTLKAEHLDLRLGEITGLVGENATGKSTLFKILAGELAQQSGQLCYPLFDPKRKLDWTDLKLRIAYVPQELPQWTGSLRENLIFEAARHGILGKENQQEVDFIIQRLGLILHINKSWQELSGGYKLRFALAKALVWRTQLLILDEPLAFLDIKTQMIVLSDLRNLAKSLKYPLSVLISSQHLHETEAVADQMFFMRDGVLENLGRTKNFNKDRNYNLFEISCDRSFMDFKKALKDIEHLKIWQIDHIYFIKGPLSINAQELLNTFSEARIEVSYFRDISQSVKTKFYEDII